LKFFEGRVESLPRVSFSLFLFFKQLRRRLVPFFRRTTCLQAGIEPLRYSWSEQRANVSLACDSFHFCLSLCMCGPFPFLCTAIAGRRLNLFVRLKLNLLQWDRRDLPYRHIEDNLENRFTTLFYFTWSFAASETIVLDRRYSNNTISPNRYTLQYVRFINFIL